MSARQYVAKAAFYGTGHAALWDAYCAAHSYEEGGQTYPANSADLAAVIAWVDGLSDAEFTALVTPTSARPAPPPIPRNDQAARLAALDEYVAKRITALEAAIRLADADVAYDEERAALEELLPIAAMLRPQGARRRPEARHEG